MNCYSPLSEVRAIAERPDRRLAIDLFIAFSRLEYALKRIGYGRVNKQGVFEVNWEAYNYGALPKFPSGGPIEQALKLFSLSPPLKQTGVKKWGQDNSTEPLGPKRLFVLVRRVRNNLFHGGKSPDDPTELSRNSDLMSASLHVIDWLLESDVQLRSAFIEGLD